MFFSRNQHINIVYPNENFPFISVLKIKNIDTIHGWSSSRFKDKFWFQTKRRLQMIFSRNQCIDILYPNDNYLVFLATHEIKLDSINRWSMSCLKDKHWFQTNEGYQCFFCETSTSKSFVLAPHKNKLEYMHGWCLSRFNRNLWFQTKRMLEILFSQNQCINIVYPNENYPFVLAPCVKKLDSIHG